METNDLAAILGSMGQTTRLEILKLLAPMSKDKTQTGLSAGKIASTLKLAPPTLSFHLKDMTLRGLLAQQRVGREIHYQANLDLILDALEALVVQLEKE
jgi:ArsR family transcriptional regulator, arsenate/arsenite/antimonite-responsive transcriptional repressor